MSKQRKFTTEELGGFCKQVAMVLKSGISLDEGIYMLLEEVEDKKTKEVLEKMDEMLKDNETFHHAMKETGAFLKYLLSMVHIGEKSGKLEEVLEAMVVYYERETSMKESIRNVIAYPMIMFAMIAVILLVLVLKILPMFQNVFRNLNVDVASSSSRVMRVGMITGEVVAIVALIILVVVAGLLLWYHTDGGEKVLKRWSGSFFATKKTARLMAIGKFVSSMSVMISSGMDPEESLDMAREVVEETKVQKKVEKCYEGVKERKSLADSLRESKLVTGMQGRMLSVAEKSGLTEEVLDDISRQYDEQITGQLSSMCTKLETTLVLSLSLIVGAILISIMLPLVSIITAIG
ncbi:MAG: hypothetical protein HFJ09_08660 [Lachnospiraceae bacterium]|nr:hypothetical protein [Lachnospiraceae bacterium]